MPNKKKEALLYCDWQYDYKKEEKIYFKCSRCGRIKRSDLPNIQPCTGSSITYKSMLRKILGQEVTDRDIKDMEKEEEEETDKENESGQEE